ncbi:MAG: hypothetical protein RLZZ11_1613 [Cyanobacteriota bacterium]
MKTADLIGPALDWAVDKAEGHIRPDGGYYCGQHGVSRRYSTDWAQGGPIIERERITVQFGPLWTAVHSKRLGRPSYGPTPLVAAMRCFVASRLGDKVDVPDDLWQFEDKEQ